MANDALETLLNLKKKRAAEGVDVAPPDFFTGQRNQVKTDAMRKLLGLEGPATGENSQADYEQAYEGIVLPREERAFQEKILPSRITAQGNIEAARAQGEAQAANANRADARQQSQQTFQAEQNQLSRDAAAARQEKQMNSVMVPSMDPLTGITSYVPRPQAGGQRTGGSASERADIMGGANTLDNIDMLLGMGNELDWKGIGPAGGVKNSLYKFLGMGDPREDDFRAALQKVRADIMFGSGGKQLTASEQKVAAGYLADIYTNPTAAKSRLEQIKEILGRAQARRTGQVVPAPSFGTDNDWEDVQ